jgi:hypothetical protein
VPASLTGPALSEREFSMPNPAEMKETIRNLKPRQIEDWMGYLNRKTADGSWRLKPIAEYRGTAMGSPLHFEFQW